jgi:translation initiation factor 1
MGRKDRNTRMVYSTNQDLDFEEKQDAMETLLPEKQNLIIRLDKKQRRGKQVTLINGFAGNDDDLKKLGKMLKSKCGVGGSAKNGEIIIQGDFREKIEQLLTGLGYRCKIAG